MDTLITELRNARSLQADNQRLDVEINHPQHGWIPYTIDPADDDATIDNAALLYLIGADFEAYIAPPQPTEAEHREALRTAASIGKGKFCMGLIGLGIIAPSEAVSAARGNWPTSMDAFLSYLPADQAIAVQIDWATETTINRNNVFVLTLGSWLDDVTPEMLDTLFGIG